MTRGSFSWNVSCGGGGAWAGGRRRVVVVVVVAGKAVAVAVEGRGFAVGGSRWLGWEAVGRRSETGDRAVIVVVAAADAIHVSFAYSEPWSGAEALPEGDTDGGCCSNAGLDDVDYCCRPAARVPMPRQSLMVDKNSSC